MTIDERTGAAAVLASLGVGPLAPEDGRLLDAAGYLVVPEVLDAGALAAVRHRIEHLLAEAPRRNPMWRPRETLHLGGLVGEGAAFDRTWLAPPVLAAVAHLLGPDFWMSGLTYRAPRSGHGAQQLHRVARIGGGARLDLHPLATAIFPLVDFTADNGATRVLPGSHRQWHVEVPDDAASPHHDEQPITCRAGSAIVFTEHLFHSGTTNRSAHRRDALLATYHRRGVPLGHHALTVDNATLDRLGDAALLLIP